MSTVLPYVRQGLISLIGDGPQRITLRVNARHEAAVDLHVYGPGDVVGFDPRVVVRTDPRAGATDFEANYLALIEFDAPDFPWLFSSPAPPDPARVLPWVCLVVVRLSDRVRFDTAAASQLPVLTCPASELPDLAESWAWAHAHVLASGVDVRDALSNPPLNVSRLICPRRLGADVQYLACVVPTFKVGVEAGLSGQPSSPVWTPAWAANDPEVRLPVYHSWTFRTASGGDFESLASRLSARPLRSTIGRRDLDASDPGLGLPSAGTLHLEGALRRLQPDDRPSAPSAFRDALRNLLGMARASDADGSRVPVVAPPVYGAWHAGTAAIDDSAPAWLTELNLDPASRAAAAFGALVVQRDQEHLVAAAWSQSGDLARANHTLRHMQAAYSVLTSIHRRRIEQLRPERLMQVAAPALSRIRLAGQRLTMWEAARTTALPMASLSPAFRRVTRPSGPVALRARVDTRSLLSIVARLADGSVTAVASSRQPGGMLTPDTAMDLIAAGSARPPRFGDVTPTLIRQPRTPGVRPAPPRTPGATVPRAAPDRLRTPLAAHHERLMAFVASPVNPQPPPLPLATTATSLRYRLQPGAWVVGSVRARLPGVTRPTGVDPLSPLVSHPSFPQPMYEPLRAIAQELILPRADEVPADTVASIEINRRFIEAYMAGANDALRRELLWRGFPADQQGTYFSSFWNSGAGDATTAPHADIRPIETWTGRLGEHTSGDAAALVLLLRGEVVRRFPGASIFAMRAIRHDGRRMPGPEERLPRFRGTLDPDIVFVGFDLTPAEAAGRVDGSDDGWFFIVQEQAGDPRFGFEVDSGAGVAAPAPSWSGTTWEEIGAYHLRPNGYISIDGPLAGTARDGVTWGRDSAHMAVAAMQVPFRLALHGDVLTRGAE